VGSGAFTARFRLRAWPKPNACLKSDFRGAEDVVDLERLVDLIEPFGPIGCAAATALIDWQFQFAQLALDLFLRHHVLHARESAQQSAVIVSISRVQGPTAVLKRNAGVGLAATAFDLQPVVAAIEALCDHGGGLRRPAETSIRSNQAGSLRLMGGFLRAPGISAGVRRSERSVSIDNIARIARGLKVKPSATRCATRSAGALSEIRNERWTIDIRRRKQSDLVLNYIPIGRN